MPRVRDEMTMYEMGKSAFERGIKAAPCLDPDFMATAFTSGKPFCEQADEWTRGWTEANLNAPVPGWTDKENEALRAARRGK